MGAYIRTNGGVVPAKAAQFLPGPYRIRDVALTVEAFVTSKTPVGTLRAPGRFEANFFRERLLDMVARDLELDPMEFRRRNLIKEAGAAVPRPASSCPTSRRPISTPATITSTFERAVAEIGWDKNKHAAGPTDRRPLSWACGGAVRRKRRLGQGERAAGHRAGRHGQRLCRLVGAGAGARNHVGAGRRRHAEAAVRAASRSCMARPPICARASARLRRARWWSAARR